MEKSKLIALLRTFNSSELREFKDFINSPYFNKNQELARFYAYLKPLAPSFSPKRINKTKVYKTLYPEEVYDEKAMKYLMSFLLKLAERFIGQKRIEREEVILQCYQLEACIDRHLEKSYTNIHRNTVRKLDAYPHRDAHFHFQQYLLADVENRYFSQQNVRNYNQELQFAADYFNRYTLGQRLKYMCEMLNRKKFLSANYNINGLEYLRTHLATHNYSDTPVIAIYSTILETLINEEDTVHFERLKQLLAQHFDNFAPSEMKQMYMHAINYGIRKIRQKEEHFVEETLNLYMMGIENKLLYEGEYLSPWTYMNIIKLGLRLRRYEWTENAIRMYANDLDSTYQTNALNYCLADLFYHKNDLEKAMLFLREVEYSEIFFDLNARLMLLKIYYDTKEKEALQSLMLSFKTYLKRNRLISNTMRETYMNFLVFLSQLLKNLPNSQQKLIENIKNAPLLVDRQWLLDKVNSEVKKS